MRDQAPIDQVETVVLTDSKPIQPNPLQKFELEITNVTKQNELLRKENNDLRSDLRLEIAAYAARKVEIENMLQSEMEKMNEERKSNDEQINALMKEKQGLKESMIESMIESRHFLEKEIENEKNLTLQMKHKSDSKIQLLIEENQVLESKYDGCLSDLQNSIQQEIEKHESHKCQIQNLKDSTKRQLNEVISKSNEELSELQGQYQVIKEKANSFIEKNNELEEAISDLQKRYDDEKELSNIQKHDSEKVISKLKVQISTYAEQAEELNSRLIKESSDYKKKLNEVEDNYKVQKNNLSQTINDLNDGISNINKTHEEELERIRAEFDVKAKAYSKEIDKLKSQIENNNVANEKEQHKLRNDFEAKLKEKSNEIEGLCAKIANDAAIHANELQELNTRYEGKTAAIENNHAEHVLNLFREINTLKASIENNAVANDECYNKMKTKLEKEIKDLVTLHKKECADTKSVSEEKLANLTASHEKEFTKIKSKLQEHVECQAVQTKTIEDLKSKLEVINIALEEANEKLKKKSANENSMRWKEKLLLQDKIEKLEAELQSKESNFKEESKNMLIAERQKIGLSMEETKAARKEADMFKEELIICRQRFHVLAVVCLASFVMHIVF